MGKRKGPDLRDINIDLHSCYMMQHECNNEVDQSLIIESVTLQP